MISKVISLQYLFMIRFKNAKVKFFSFLYVLNLFLGLDNPVRYKK